MESILFIVPVLVFVFGLIIGSFLNVVIFRYNTGRSAATGRSCCFSCGKSLHWYELVPVVSYMVQQGKCRSCKSVLSYQYITVEFLTGTVFALIAQRLGVQTLDFNPVELVFWWIVASTLIVITVYDLRHTVIPDEFSLVVGVLGLGALYERGGGLADLSVGVITALLFASIWYFSGGKAMGLGDAKLVLGIGWLMPWPLALSGIIASFWFGAIIGTVLILAKKRKLTFKSEIPFAPFLALGFISIFLTQVSFIPFLVW